MRELDHLEYENIKAGGGVGCVAAILTSVSITLGAAAISAGTIGAGVLLTGYMLGKLGATAFIISECGGL